jgi:di/tricarboxylate transporter
VAPIALTAAQSMGLEPYAFMMAVALAASMAFATPVASPPNTLVMGAGGYRFIDYMKIGIPMIIIAGVVAMFALPVFFPF